MLDDTVLQTACVCLRELSLDGLNIPEHLEISLIWNANFEVSFRDLNLY